MEFVLAIDGDNIRCSISESNEYAFQQRSDGFKRFVAFLLTISAQSASGALENCLILIDEPDTGLHPSSARYLRDELLKISERNTVVFSTHSIFMIDHHQINRHLIVKKENEITTIEEASEGNTVKEEVIFNAINYSVFEHLKEFNIIVEGWRDKKLFEIATEKHEDSIF